MKFDREISHRSTWLPATGVIAGWVASKYRLGTWSEEVIIILAALVAGVVGLIFDRVQFERKQRGKQ